MKKKIFDIFSATTADTEELARLFSAMLVPGDVITFYGPLGSGKTFFVSALSKALEINATVTSPSFTIMNEYTNNGKISLFHFDLYRLKDIDDLAEIGFGEYLYQSGIVCIEWPQLAEPFLPLEYYQITLSIIDEKQRRIIIEKCFMGD